MLKNYSQARLKYGNNNRVTWYFGKISNNDKLNSKVLISN